MNKKKFLRKNRVVLGHDYRILQQAKRKYQRARFCINTITLLVFVGAVAGFFFYTFKGLKKLL